MSLSPLAKKLRLQNIKQALIVNAPEGFETSLGNFPDEVLIDQEISGHYDYAHLFIKNKSELDRYIDSVLEAVEYDAVLWISYPKGSSGVKTDINRDTLWADLLEKGIRPVTQVSIDDVWSAIRFRPSEAVGK